MQLVYQTGRSGRLSASSRLEGAPGSPGTGRLSLRLRRLAMLRPSASDRVAEPATLQPVPPRGSTLRPRQMVVSLREYLLVIVGSVVLSLAIVAAVWPWTRRLRILVGIGLSAVVGIVIWNTLLNVTNAQSLNVDSPFLGLSVQDVGSGVCAFLVTLLVLRLAIATTEPLSRLLAASTTVGLLTILVDLFG